MNIKNWSTYILQIFAVVVCAILWRFVAYDKVFWLVMIHQL